MTKDGNIKGKLVIIDGNSLANRAFYALPPLTTSSGEHTNAVYGFANMLFRLLEEEKPDLLAVAFDRPAPTFRHVAYEEYKAHRKKMPDELASQIPLIKEIIRALGLPIFEIDGYEADDVIGTISKEAESQGYVVVIVTGDRDAFQLISPNVRVMVTRKGITEMETFDEALVEDRYGIKPCQVVDVKALAGDASDNIPGVRGIGEKTAYELIRNFGSLEGILANLDQVPKKRVRELISQDRDTAILSKKLATIDRDVPIELDLPACRMGTPDMPRLRELFSRLEFKSLLKRLDSNGLAVSAGANAGGPAISPAAGAGGPAPVVSPGVTGVNLAGDVRCVLTPGALQELVNAFLTAGECVFSVVRGGKSPVDADMVGIGLATPDGTAYYVPVGHRYEGAPGIPEDEALMALKPVFENPLCRKVAHDAKPDIVMLTRRGLHFRGLGFDTMIAAYLLNPGASSFDLPDVARKYLGTEVETPSALAACLPRTSVVSGLAGCQVDEVAAALGRCLRSVLHLSRELSGLIRRDGMETLLDQIELPLVGVLAGMELSGVKIDERALGEVSNELGNRINELMHQIYDLAGEEFNINSTRQLAAILFEKLKLPPVRKTKTGYSTDAEVLEELANYHPIAASILEYRELVKLKSTYADALTHLVNPVTGRIHTTFHQAVTATGRLSSSDPNLQNIPVRSEEGRRIRKVFVPGRPGWRILSADYSQIELRILAHFSKDEALVRAFRNDEDIHTSTAASVFGIAPDQVTPSMRARAKAVNFGIVYGITDYGLARGIGLSRSEARDFIDRYFAHYRGVREYLDRTVEKAREDGYVTTLFGRRRYLPDLSSTRIQVRRFAERTAMNTPIQGTAADIIKLAMVRVARELARRKLAAEMILQVHDELVFEVPDGEIREVAGLVKEIMEGVVDLEVPLKVDVEVGPNWLDTKPLEAI
ncbi:MAG TPA: DNA polymerase I [Firmicutes bacterium]|nr:DNA polymerase I [Bacillota bacterium]